MLKHVFGFAKHQWNCIYRLGYNLTLTRNKEDAVLNKTEAIAEAIIDRIRWYVPHYTPSIPQQFVLSKQTLSKTPTELRFIEKSVLMTEAINENLRNFELVTHENLNTPVWKINGFQQRNRQDSQNLYKDSFNRQLATSAECIRCTEKHRDAA